MEYWKDNQYDVGRFKEVPGVFSQGLTIDELEENIIDAYQLLVEDQSRVEIPNEIMKLKEIIDL